MHTRNFNFSKIFTKSLWEQSFDSFDSFDLLKRLSANEANTMVKLKFAVMDEGERSITDRCDVSKYHEERPNFPTPIPPPPHLRRSGKREIDEFTLSLSLSLKGISPGDFSDVLIKGKGKGKGKGKSKCQLLAHECCLSANTFEKFINININGVPQ